MLLDTHVWLWTAEGNEQKLGRRTRRMIERARALGRVHLSIASVFELATLHASGRIDLVPSAERFIHDSLEVAGLRLIEITTGIALDGGLIPSTMLADPIDRLIVASAIHAGIPLITRDERILAYARATRTVRVVDAAR